MKKYFKDFDLIDFGVGLTLVGFGLVSLGIGVFIFGSAICSIH